jgi:thioredoxin reductase/Pyruvate/2-oxoacid:ferredoxin oxidoreductase delta subunit
MTNLPINDILIYAALGLLLAISVVRSVKRLREKEGRARAAAARSGLHSNGPRAQHPHIDVTRCIGCGTCADACPEGEVLGIIAGRAAIVNGGKCIGHGLCAEACPVGAIEIVMAPPGIAADVPALTAEYETEVRGMFVVGELGGLALIKNAVNQGRDCVDTIARRLRTRGGARVAGVHDLCIVGAGPGGISASLRAIEKGLSYVTLEQDEFGGTVAKFPKQKLVMTSPVEFPLHGRFRKLEISKEELLEFWLKLSRRADLEVRTHDRVDGISRGPDGLFTVASAKGSVRARHVILAIGRRGTPRRLGVKGEELSKVMYGLIEAEAYTGSNLLVVGGGDSAIEAAMGLAHQKGNTVTLSYRGEAFSRIKERNEQRIADCIRKGMVRVLFRSNVKEIRGRSVLIDVAGTEKEIPNTYVWVFAGGTPPRDFLQKCGLSLGPRDLTKDAQVEAKAKGLVAA